MKSLSASLTTDVVSVYDQTKTTIQGRVLQQTVSGVPVLGPPLNKYMDTINDTGGVVTPLAVHVTSSGRIFGLAAPVSGAANVVLYEQDVATGVNTYIGRLVITLPNTAATSHTYRAIKVLDSGTTGWKILIATTGSVLINGGLFIVNNVDRSDFVPVGFPTIPMATGSGQKAVYSLQDPANIGSGNLLTAAAGAVLDAPNNRIYVHNGLSATHQYYVYDTSVTPTYSTQAVTITVASPGVLTATAHGYNNLDPVVLSTTGALPTGLVAGTVYFTKNVTANTFELSATTGGASINTTGVQSGTHSVGRAFGTTGSNYLHKTGNLPALTGTLLLLDSEDYAVPQHTTNATFPCAFFCTSSAMYLGRLSDLTAGVTSWPSLVTANLLGSVNQITAPTATFAAWSNVLDRAVYSAAPSIFVMKQMVNNQIDKIFGGASNTYQEGKSNLNIELQTTALSGLDIENGYMFFTNSATVGQRGIYASDLRSDELMDYSYIVTKVLDTPNSTYSYLSSIEQLYAYTGILKIQYRTSGFGSITGGWVDIPEAADLGAVAPGNQVQFKILFDTLGLDTSIPAQVHDINLGYQPNSELSDNWEYSYDNSSTGSPTRFAFRLKVAYSSVVPVMHFRGYDTTEPTNILLMDFTTAANPARFEYSTDSGASWLPLGTIPNVVGTMIRITPTSPPGVDVRPSVRES